MSDIINYGKANVSVKISNKLPNIDKDKAVFDFDCHANIYNQLTSMGMAFPPVFLETLQDDSKQFCTFFPVKRHYPVDNFITDGTNVSMPTPPTTPYIAWTPTVVQEGVVAELLGKDKFDTYTLQYPPKYTKTAYDGPKWVNSPKSGEAPPNDLDAVKSWIKNAQSIGVNGVASTTTQTTTKGLVAQTYYVTQACAKDGLWWGIESSPFLKENTPFWINIDRESSPPTNKHETMIIISLGIDDPKNAFDLYLGTNKKPAIYDYPKGRQAANPGTGLPTYKLMEFKEDLAKVWATEGHIELGFMTVAGKLIVFSNKMSLIYTRMSTDTQNTVTPAATSGKSTPPNTTIGEVLEAKIGAGRMRVYGTNCQININVSPMTFFPMGICALPLPALPPQKGQTVTPKWEGIDYKLDNNGEGIAKLPQSPSNPSTPAAANFGVDCKAFTSDFGNSSPTGFAMHSQGFVYLKSATSVGIQSAQNNDYYVLYMVPESIDLDLGKTVTIPYAGCPYFFRLKGRYEIPSTTVTPAVVDISSDVFSVSEQYQMDDYFSITGTASVVLYNKNGKYDYLKDNQVGIELSWGWNGTINKTFTGLVTGVSSAETPGKEELTLNCSDYMFILKNTQIFNSPYYDGMLLFYAVKDLVLKGGVITVINDWDNSDQYYLPAGYSFTAPAVKFGDNSMLYECIKSMVERAEAFFYFDKDGQCHVRKLPGGLFSVGANENNVANFVSDPSVQKVGDEPITILDTKNVEFDYSDTVNRITIFSLDRNTRNAIVWTKSASANEDRLLYNRLLYVEQAALGRYAVVVGYADELAQRVFHSIRKTSFKTVGTGKIIYPLAFCTVDGLEYRITGLSRKYDASNNDFSMEYNCEWLGG